MKLLEGLVAVPKISLPILNEFGAIVSGIWLLVIRAWAALGLAISLFIGYMLILEFGHVARGVSSCTPGKKAR